MVGKPAFSPVVQFFHAAERKERSPDRSTWRRRRPRPRVPIQEKWLAETVSFGKPKNKLFIFLNMLSKIRSYRSKNLVTDCVFFWFLQSVSFTCCRLGKRPYMRAQRDRRNRKPPALEGREFWSAKRYFYRELYIQF